MHNSPTIRPARDEDLEGIIRLLAGLDAIHRERLPWLFREPADATQARPFLAEHFDKPLVGFFVADAGDLVGVVHGALRVAPELPIFVQQRWAVIDDLVVDPAARRCGVGRRLVEAFEAWADDHGAPWVELGVYEFNSEARRFYESLGYLPLRTVLRKSRPRT